MVYSSSVILLLLCISFGHCIDLTLIPETKGSTVVIASLAKISESRIFSRDDQQLFRRIAFVETNDGLDDTTYSDPNNHGGIWQLSEDRYQLTKDETLFAGVLQPIYNVFHINWTSTSWTDLRKPFFSALASRIFTDFRIQNEYPFSTDIPSQAQFWKDFFTISNKNESDFSAGVVQLNEEERCEVSALDIWYLLDDSGSLGEMNFNTTKVFLQNMTRNFPVGPNRVRIGLITFEYEIRFRFNLNTYNNTEDVIAAIDAVPYVGIGTNTSGALEVVRQQGFTTEKGARPKALGVPRIAIVVTDGLSFEPNKTVVSAEKLHNESVIVYAIGIQNANQDELNAIASDDRYAVSVDSFDASILSAVQASTSRVACEATQSLGTGDMIETTIDKNDTQYIEYPLPPDGTTIKVNTSKNCRAIIFGSTFIAVPNSAFNDIILNTSNYEDAFIARSAAFNPNFATTLFLAITGGNDEPCEVTINTEEGDTSTDPVTITSDIPSVISRVVGEELQVLCSASGKPTPSITWYFNGVNIMSSCSDCVVNESIATSNVSSYLRINTVTASHDGQFTCSASNTTPRGTATESASFRLNVQSLNICPLQGSDQCNERIVLAGCLYLSTILSANDIPLACSNKLNNI